MLIRIGNLSLIFSLLFLMASCGEGPTTRDTSVVSGDDGSELEEAAALVKGETTLGSCQLKITPLVEREALRVVFAYRPQSGSDLAFDVTMSNRESNRSKVKVERSFLNREPTGVVLEKIDVRTAPAFKYIVQLGLQNRMINSIQVDVYHGSKSNRVRSISCQ